MIKITQKRDCCGCNACGDICPRSAITYQTDNEGFWYPDIDSSKCIDCGLCNKVCPIENNGKIKNDNFRNPITYAAIHKNNQIRFDSTSGGMFTALAEPFIKDCGYVGGAVYTEDWNVKQIVTDNIDDLKRLRSSKYIQSDATGYYKTIKQLLDDGKKVMAVGLPCQIAALRQYLSKEYDSLITVDLICRYINSPMVYRKYLDYLEKEYNSKVVYIKPKNKEFGWRKLTHKVVFENGSTYYGTFQIDKFMKASMRSNCLSRPACYDCAFKGFQRYADISLGDYWSPKGENVLDDDTGTSVVMLNSEKGAKYFEKIKKRIRYNEVPLDKVIKGNPALTKPMPRESIDRDVFYKRIKDEPFDAVVDDMCSTPVSFKHKAATILRVIKRELAFSHCRIKPFFQFIYLNFFHPAVHSNFIKGNVVYVSPHCDVEISRKASVELNGFLTLGGSPFKHTKLETRIRMAEGAKLIIGNLSTGGYGFGYGSDVEIFKNATLISKGGPSTNMGTTIICQSKIVIGEMVAIGRNVAIRDNNGGHLININGYMDARPVIIGEHVWLCEQSTILSGVKIGDGTIVGARSVVNRSLPPHVTVAGNPAQIGSEGIEWKM